VADFFEIDEQLLSISVPLSRAPHAVITHLRVISCWVFHDTIIECRADRIPGRTNEEFSLNVGPLSDASISKQHLTQILCPLRHPFALARLVEIQQKGTFELSRAGFSLRDNINDLSERLISYAIEKAIHIIWIFDNDYIAVFFNESLCKDGDIRDIVGLETEMNAFAMEANTNHRGIGERACGQWKLRNGSGSAFGETKHFRACFGAACSAKERKHLVNLRRRLQCYFQTSHILRGLAIEIKGSLAGKDSKTFQVLSFGEEAGVSKTDLSDLLAVSGLTIKNTTKSTKKQKIVFPNGASPSPSGADDAEEGTSWARPPVKCIPEGARLLSLLASSRRREHLVRLESLNEPGGGDDEDGDVKLYLDPSQTKLSARWKRFGTDRAVYVPDNCVPATAAPLEGSETLYCAVSNCLEVKGGGIRVEGLTVLPSGPLFLILARLSFGLFDNEQRDATEEELIRLLTEHTRPDSKSMKKIEQLETYWRDRINVAFDFHNSSMDLGEQLVCFPDMARRLHSLFDGVDGYPVAESWNVDDNIFTRDNLEQFRHHRKMKKKSVALSPSRLIGLQHQKERRGSGKNNATSQSSLRTGRFDANATSDTPKGTPRSTTRQRANDVLCLTPTVILKPTVKKNREPRLIDQNSTPKIKSQLITEPTIAAVQEIEIDNSTSASMHHMFLTDGAHTVAEHELPSTNLLALVVQHVRESLEGRAAPVAVNLRDDWTIREVTVPGCESLYEATFRNRDLCYVDPILGASSESSSVIAAPSWFAGKGVGSACRPRTIADALDCIPFAFRGAAQLSMMQVNAEKSTKLVFRSIEMAMRMEAAFWLERQFWLWNEGNHRHWYEQGDISRMIGRLRDACLRLQEE